MSKFTFVKPGVLLIEKAPVPIRHIDDIGRVDIIGDKVIVTLIEMEPGDTAGVEAEAVIVDRIAFRSEIATDLVQVFWSALAQAGVALKSKKPLPMN